MSTLLPDREFAEALGSLPLVALIDKAREFRTTVAHLEYSNRELRDYIAAAALPEPDPDCADAIEHNGRAIDRLRRRAALVQAELLRRPDGCQLPDELDALTDLLKKEVRKDVDQEVALFEQSMKQKDADAEALGDAGASASATTAAADPAAAAGEEVMSVPAATAGTAGSRQSGKYNDADLARLFRERMGVDLGSEQQPQRKEPEPEPEPAKNSQPAAASSTLDNENEDEEGIYL